MNAAAIFDLDGTILNTSEDVLKAINITLGDLNLQQNAFSIPASCINHGGKALLTSAAKLQNIDLTEIQLNNIVRHFHFRYSQMTTHTSYFFDGIVETFNTLRAAGIPLGIATNKAAHLTHPVAEHHKLSRYFDVIVCGDTLINRKPQADPLIHAALALNRDPEDCVMVGDSIFDKQAADAAKMEFIAADYGFASEAFTNCETKFRAESAGVDCLFSLISHIIISK